MKRKLVCIAAIAVLLLTACKKESYEYPFRDPRLSYEERAEDLLARLSLEEKVSQMLNAAPGIDRLGIPPYDWWNECLHGIGRTRFKVTVYPQAIGMAAGWDKDALRQMADFTAEEGRAVYNTTSVLGDYGRYNALTYWTPNINIFRDPRWGRGQETYGEDPYLTTVLGVNFVNGLQGDDSRYWKAAGCAKHYAVHSGPEHNRHEFDISVSSYDLWDTYLPAFKALSDADVAGFMCAYNAYDGQPCCGSDKLMIDILRKDWGYKGYITSDCGAIDDFFKHHKTHPDAKEASVDAVFHGTDLECGRSAYYALTDAVNEGLISEELIDTSLKRLFVTRMKLGLFDPVDQVPYNAIDSTRLEAPAHEELALKMARQSIVLLKNDNLLPLDKTSLKKIALVGPNANNPEVQLGNYNGFPTRIVTPYEGLKDELGDQVEIYCDPVIDYYGDSPKSFASAISQFQDADVIIYVGGISPRIEGEEMKVDVEGFYRGDRTSIQLPRLQTDFLKALKATGKPVVFVMMSGSAIGIPWEAENIPAIVNTWYGGQSVGTALTDILFGKYSPSGKLPVTFYASDKDLPDFEDYDMSNRTYKYFKGQALYPFGHGLSYTSFSYDWMTQPRASYTREEIIECSLVLTNTGAMDGDEVAQLYIQYPNGQQLPIKELRGFDRRHLKQGEKTELSFSIPVKDLAKWNEEKAALEVVPGTYSLFVGGSSEEEKVRAQFVIN